MADRLIVAEAFAEEKLGQQAADLAELAQENRGWLQEVRPDTYRNFSSANVAMSSMRRVMGSRTIDGHIFRDHATRQTVALGTLTTGLCIYDPRGDWLKTLTGDEIDFWTAGDVTEGESMSVARLLLSAAKTPQALAILSPREQERAQGVPLTMRPVGIPGRIRVPLGKRDYGLRKLREPMQVYLDERPRRFVESVR